MARELVITLYDHTDDDELSDTADALHGIGLDDFFVRESDGTVRTFTRDDNGRFHIAPTDESRMDAAGYEKGRAAGSWVLDGNSSDDDARNVLRLADDCELTANVSSPLTGEMADDPTYAEVFADANVEYMPDDTTTDDARMNELLDRWSDGWYRGFEDQATDDARAMLASDDDTTTTDDARGYGGHLQDGGE